MLSGNRVKPLRCLYNELYKPLRLTVVLGNGADVCPDRTHCLMHLASPKPIMKRTHNHATEQVLPYIYMYVSYVVYVCLIYLICIPYT